MDLDFLIPIEFPEKDQFLPLQHQERFKIAQAAQEFFVFDDNDNLEQNEFFTSLGGGNKTIILPPITRRVDFMTMAEYKKEQQNNHPTQLQNHYNETKKDVNNHIIQTLKFDEQKLSSLPSKKRKLKDVFTPLQIKESEPEIIKSTKIDISNNTSQKRIKRSYEKNA